MKKDRYERRQCHPYQWLFAAHGLPEPVAEYRFAPPRLWRFDWAWPAAKVALEQDGGVWTQGRHLRGNGFLGDMAKLNQSALMGWRVFRCTPRQLESGEIMPMLRQAMGIGELRR